MKLLLFVAMLVTILISKGDCQCLAKTCQCGSKNLTVSQEETGKIYNFSYVEYNVTIGNQCNCEQSQIYLWCSGFQSYTSVDPTVFKIQKDICILQQGSPLSAKASVSFIYAWTQQWPLNSLFSQSTC